MANLLNHPASIPEHIEHAATVNPTGVCAIAPETTPNGDLEWVNLTFSGLATAVNQMAWWIENNVGVGNDGEVIDYMGSNDLRYPICIAAALKAGYIPMLTSPRNSVEGQESLLRSTRCHKIIYSSEVESQIKEIKSVFPEVNVFEVPTLADLVHPESEPLHYSGRQSSEENAACLVLHTSGSTGIPKPIYLRVGGLAVLNTLATLQPEDGHQHANAIFGEDRRPMLAPVPFFHGMGIVCLMRSIARQGTLVRLPSERVMNAGLIIEIINQTNPALGIFPPSLLEDLSNTPEGLEALSKLDYIVFGGGPLSIESGNKICKRTPLIAIMGSTEAALFANLIPKDPEDWPYFKWSSAAGMSMEEAGEGLKELVVKRKDRKYQAIFHTFPELEEWRTNDLFEEHPTKPGLWKYRGRRDDVVVLSNGEKFNPVSIEKSIEGHPLVKGALVVGQARFQAGLIIEPVWESVGLEGTGLNNLIEDIWPLVEQANTEAPAHARIYKSKIAIANRDKPFQRTAKGSIMRFATNTLYATEIEDLYSNEGGSDLGSLDSHNSSEDLVAFLKRAFSAAVPSFDENISDDDDIFALGVDSLGVVSVTDMINHALPDEVSISRRVIYQNPTLQKVATALTNLLHGEGGITNQTREEGLQALVKKYTAGMIDPHSTPSKHTVILTGSTGSLGNHTLEVLLQHPSIDVVYCLNRSAEAPTRQRRSFTDRGAPLDILDKAIFLQTDFGKEHFGLSDEQYTSLQQCVTCIIHNAWSVNFNQSLESYENTHIAGTRRLIDFAASATYRPGIVFISSIASIGNWKALFGATPVPENLDVIFNNALPFAQGYAESKYVTSRILAESSKRLGLRTAIVQAGQLAGPSAEYVEQHGGMAVWNPHEWLPSLIKTSVEMRKFPETLGNQERVDWMPMDKAAGALVDVSLSVANTDAANCEVFHLVNPRVTKWSSLLPTIRLFFETSANIKTQSIPYGEWLDTLKAIPVTTESMGTFPSLKLLNFYEGLVEEGGGLPALESVETEKKSRSLRETEAVKEADMLVWLKGWGF